MIGGFRVENFNGNFSNKIHILIKPTLNRMNFGGKKPCYFFAKKRYGRY